MSNAVKVSSGFTQYPFATHIGETGRLFYNANTGELRLSDGVTAGGVPVYVAVSSANIGNLAITNTTIGTLSANANITIQTNGIGNINLVGNVQYFTTASGPVGTPLFSVDNFGNVIVNGKLNVNGPSYFIGTETNFGNITINGYTQFNGDVVHTGNVNITGVTTNNGSSVFNGDLTIAGNASIVGNTNITGNTLVTGQTTVTGNTLVTGTTTVVGQTYLTGNSYVTGNTFVTGTTTVTGNTYVTGQVTTITGNTYLQGNSFVTGTISITGNSVQTGLATFIVSTPNASEGAVEITGDIAGNSQTLVNPGGMLHITGQYSLPSRVFNDGQNNYPTYVGRRFNGNVTTPTQVLNNQDVLRVGGTAYTSTGWQGNGIARISMLANEDQTSTNQGSRIEFWLTPNGNSSSNIANVVVLTSSTMSVNANVAIGANSTLTTPRVVINDGGIRTINGGIWANVSFSTDSLVLAYNPAGAGTVPFTVNLSNYQAGAVVRLHIRVGNTSRDINYGIAGADNSSTGAISWNGNGGGSVAINNTTLQLVYTCYDGTAANTYVTVTHI